MIVMATAAHIMPLQALGQRGYNAHKLVLFGDFEQIFPWLLRRLEVGLCVVRASAGVYMSRVGVEGDSGR